jgi:hypothetical protein
MLYALSQAHTDLEVIYVVAGTDIETGMHIIRFVSSAALDETKARFKAITSIHVYSVSRFVPKDIAQIWSPDVELKPFK